MRKLELAVTVSVDLDKVNAELPTPTESVNHLIHLAQKRVHRLLDADPTTSEIGVDFPERH